ncbi:5-dehydro-4-deoxyglucarate dehydratase [Parahaliea maris]|uniref:Probable 5-dehydro-4-deoxyglucarate dehydratase n=1 Tax=Parahaliea maris TaxID=2716870 RepID=A0A5C8ZRG3_9GAMM|nr:5-dehydro-4-deoxyglucarate dehydratase [Parahaliea maris]TXS90250.1 5-dehydro-4-deoxyglucarate dehydratase [Parahaliea maris]
MSQSVQTIREALSYGLLSFPITDFDGSGQFCPDTYRERVESFVQNGVTAIFVAGGTGEFFSLSVDEYRQVVQIAVDTVAGRIPVFSSAGQSIPLAREYCRVAEAAGVDGILLMPPYLTECPGDGLYEYARQIISSTSLQVVYYNRGNGVMGTQALVALAEECPNLVGLKDGVGNIAALNDTIKTIGDRLVYIGGVPTAEIFAEAYLAIGVSTYSSAVFNFMPEMALSFYRALREGDQETVGAIIRNFFIPFCRLRDKKSGYAVSLIKAGAELTGRPAGSVRAPLVDPSSEHKSMLADLIRANS